VDLNAHLQTELSPQRRLAVARRDAVEQVDFTWPMYTIRLADTCRISLVVNSDPNVVPMLMGPLVSPPPMPLMRKPVNIPRRIPYSTR
jgi:hypothetical protein